MSTPCPGIQNHGCNICGDGSLSEPEHCDDCGTGPSLSEEDARWLASLDDYRNRMIPEKDSRWWGSIRYTDTMSGLATEARLRAIIDRLTGKETPRG